MTVAEKLRRATDEELARLLFQYHQEWKKYSDDPWTEEPWTEETMLEFLEASYSEKSEAVQSVEKGIRADPEDHK